MQPIKSYFSNINYYQEKEDHVFSIQLDRGMANSIFVSLFSFYWSIYLIVLLKTEITLFYLIPFVIGMIVFLLLFHRLYGIIFLKISKDTIRFKRSLFSFSYTRIRQTNSLEKVKETIVYTYAKHSKIPVFGIGLYFMDERNLKFGASLSKQERDWVINALTQIKDHYKSQRLDN